MSWRHSSFSLQKKKQQQQQQPIFLFKKKCQICFTDVKSAFPLLSQLITSHIKRVLRTLSTHPCRNRISLKVTCLNFTSLRGASPIQPPLEPDYPCLKTFPAHLVTYNLKMKCCAYRL